MGRVDVRYLEKRSLANGSTTYVWSCRRAKSLGMQPCETLGPDLGRAITRAAELNAMLDEIRAAAKAPPSPRLQPLTVGWMIERIEQSDEHKARLTKTRREVETALARIASSPLAKAPLSAITGKDIKDFHRKLLDANGADIAWRVCKWLRFALNQARADGSLKAQNPMDGFRIPRPPARQVYWLEAEVEAVITTAKANGLPSIGLAIRLAFDTGQREGDILKMAWSQVNHGEIVVRQGKTGAVVRVPALPELAAALDSTPKTSPIIIVSEGTSRPYKQYNFIHKAATVIEAAGFKGKTFGDLRRSAVVRLAQAGCTIPEIASITGHAYETCEKILEVYLPRTTPLARSAIKKLLASREK